MNEKESETSEFHICNPSTTLSDDEEIVLITEQKKKTIIKIFICLKTKWSSHSFLFICPTFSSSFAKKDLDITNTKFDHFY